MSARRLTYPTDLTDEEWQILAPSCRQKSLAAAPANTRCAR
jgi:hypothetical protein